MLSSMLVNSSSLSTHRGQHIETNYRICGMVPTTGSAILLSCVQVRVPLLCERIRSNKHCQCSGVCCVLVKRREFCTLCTGNCERSVHRLCREKSALDDNAICHTLSTRSAFLSRSYTEQVVRVVCLHRCRKHGALS